MKVEGIQDQIHALYDRMQRKKRAKKGTSLDDAIVFERDREQDQRSESDERDASQKQEDDQDRSTEREETGSGLNLVV